jgi:hypothetical protein
MKRKPKTLSEKQAVSLLKTLHGLNPKTRTYFRVTVFQQGQVLSSTKFKTGDRLLSALAAYLHLWPEYLVELCTYNRTKVFNNRRTTIHLGNAATLEAVIPWCLNSVHCSDLIVWLSPPHTVWRVTLTGGQTGLITSTQFAKNVITTTGVRIRGRIMSFQLNGILQQLGSKASDVRNDCLNPPPDMTVI